MLKKLNRAEFTNREKMVLEEHKVSVYKQKIPKRCLRS